MAPTPLLESVSDLRIDSVPKKTDSESGQMPLGQAQCPPSASWSLGLVHGGMVIYTLCLRAPSLVCSHFSWDPEEADTELTSGALVTQWHDASEGLVTRGEDASLCPYSTDRQRKGGPWLPSASHKPTGLRAQTAC